MIIRYSKEAFKAIRQSDKRKLIEHKIEQLAREPLSLSPNILKLQDRPGFRLRIQDWRVIFKIEDDVLHILEVNPRGSAYRKNGP